jgi:hypothetical protein
MPEKLKRSLLLTETQYHDAIEISEKYSWSLSKTLGKLVAFGIDEEKDKEVLRDYNEKKS